MTEQNVHEDPHATTPRCLLYTSDAADDQSTV